MQNQIGGFEIGAVLGQLLDGIAAVAQDALVAVDERDLALAQRRVVERRVVAHHPEIVGLHLDLAQIDGADRVVRDGHFVGLARAIIGNGKRVPAHEIGLSAAGLRRRFDWIHCLSPLKRLQVKGANVHQLASTRKQKPTPSATLFHDCPTPSIACRSVHVEGQPHTN